VNISASEKGPQSPQQPDGKLAIENIPLACQLDKKKRSKSLKQPASEFTVETILAKKVLKAQEFFQIKWLGYEETTWEPRNHLSKCQELLVEFEQPGTLISIPKGLLVPGYSTSQSRTCVEVIMKIKILVDAVALASVDACVDASVDAVVQASVDACVDPSVKASVLASQIDPHIKIF
jgi:hypothetical protein